jgi:cyclic pyranopterin phosphate synthase
LPDGYAFDTDFLTLPEIKILINGFVFLGTSKISITGGEPFLKKDLPDIIKVYSSARGVKHVATTSNGYKLEANIQKWVGAGFFRSILILIA